MEIEDLVHQAKNDTAKFQQTLEGLSSTSVLRETAAVHILHITEELQGLLLCTLIEHHRVHTSVRDGTLRL